MSGVTPSKRIQRNPEKLKKFMKKCKMDISISSCLLLDSVPLTKISSILSTSRKLESQDWLYFTKTKIVYTSFSLQDLVE